MMDNEAAEPMASQEEAVQQNIVKLPGTLFVRHCMEAMGFKSLDGMFDYQRGAGFFGIREALFRSMASGDAPMLMREKERMKKRMDIKLKNRKLTSRDFKKAEDYTNERIGRLLRTMREKSDLAEIKGVNQSQAQIAALMDVSVGAVQAWEYGRSRIPTMRLNEYLQIVAADRKQITRAMVIHGSMPETVKSALAKNEPEAKELWEKFMDVCDRIYLADVTVEVVPEKPPAPQFDSYKQEKAYLKEQHATPEELKAAALAPKPRKE